MKRRIGISVIAGLITFAQLSAGQSGKAPVPDLTGLYQSVPNSVTLPGGLKNSGTPEDILLLPAAAAKAKSAKFGPDPATTCQVIGPFRMMARDGNMIDVVASPRTNRTVIFFEDFFL